MKRVKLLELKTISNHNSYHGWPTLLLTKEGELLVVASAGRERHVCPFGQVHLIRSRDMGATWSEPEILANGPLDDRDAGILESAQGTILVNWFTSLAWLRHLEWVENEGAKELQRLGDGFAARCRKVRALLTPEIKRDDLHTWMVRSGDTAQTWSDKYLVGPGAGSPHGPTNLADGSILFVGNWFDCVDAAKSHRIHGQPGVRISHDDGQTWKLLAPLPVRPGDDPTEYHEPHAVQLPDGDIVVHIRNHNQESLGEILQCRSSDGGQTFTTPQSTGLLGLPAHLLVLHDGRLLTTYGYRHTPYGNRAAISCDKGESWSMPLVIDDKDMVRDLGYPSSVELPDQTIVSAWYEQLTPDTPALLRMAHWQIP